MTTKKIKIFIILSVALAVFLATPGESQAAATCSGVTPVEYAVTGAGSKTYTANDVDFGSGSSEESVSVVVYDVWNDQDVAQGNATQSGGDKWTYNVNPTGYSYYEVKFYLNYKTSFGFWKFSTSDYCGSGVFWRKPAPQPKATIQVNTNLSSARYDISRGYSDCSQNLITAGSKGNKTFSDVEPDTYYLCPENLGDYTNSVSAYPGNQAALSGGTLTFDVTYTAKPTPTPPPPPPSCQSIDPVYYEVEGSGGKTYTAKGVKNADYVIVQINYASAPGVVGELYETGYATNSSGDNWTYYVDPSTDYTYIVSFFPKWVKCGQATFVRKPAPPPPPGTIKITTNNKDVDYQFNRGKCEDGWSDSGNRTYKDMSPDYYVFCVDPVAGYSVSVSGVPADFRVRSNETLNVDIKYTARPGSISVSGCLWPNTTTFKLKGPSCSGSGCFGSLGPGNSCFQTFNNLEMGTYTISDVSNPNPNRYETVIQPTSIDLKPDRIERFIISYPEKGLSASISCDPTTVPYGSSATYTWSSTAAESCDIDIHPPSQPGSPRALPSVSGSQSSGSLFTTQDITLTCYGYVDE